MKEDLHKKYWDGNGNRSIRYWFYINRGMDWVNQFRNLFIVIVVAYAGLKLSNPAWLAVMLLCSLPLLAVAGYVQVHYVGKVLDWLNVKFSTHYGKYTYDLMEEQVRLLRKISGEKDDKPHS